MYWRPTAVWWGRTYLADSIINSDSKITCNHFCLLHWTLPSNVPPIQEWHRSYSHVWQCHGLLSMGLLWTEPQLSQRHPPLNCAYTKCESALYSGWACRGVLCGLKQLWHTSNSHSEQWCENLKEIRQHVTYLIKLVFHEEIFHIHESPP